MAPDDTKRQIEEIFNMLHQREINGCRIGVKMQVKADEHDAAISGLVKKVEGIQNSKVQLYQSVLLTAIAGGMSLVVAMLVGK